MNPIKAWPESVRALLKAPPLAGNGVHLWLFKTAAALHRCRVEPALIAQTLRSASGGCGRPIPEREIHDAVRNSAGGAAVASVGLRGQLADTKWPGRDLSQIESIARNGITLTQLADISPIRWGDGLTHTEDIIDRMFATDDLLCCATSPRCFATKPRTAWRGKLVHQAYLVPSPMRAVCGQTKDGRTSERCLENTGDRRFLVVECDFQHKSKCGRDAPEAAMLQSLEIEGITVADLCAAVLGHLATLAPLALVVHSGGKSLHGWFYCHGQPDAKLRGFMHSAVRIGADPATWTRCQLVRMPDGTRENGIRQRVVYFGPEVIV